MKTAQKILSILIIFAVIICAPLQTLASTSVSPMTGKTYTHADKFKGKKIHHGIDVSEHNGTINWADVKKTAEFAILRVGYRGYGTSGSLIKDKTFDTNIKNAKANGVKVGIYFYSQALNSAEAVEEAKKAIEYLGSNKIDLPVFYDYEFAGVSTGRLDSAWKSGKINKSIMTNNALAFLDTIKKAGYTAMLYANPDFLYGKVDHNTITKNGYGIWLANYTTKTSYTGEYILWQYSSTGSIKGISGNVDANFWYGDLSQTGPANQTTTTTTTTSAKNGFTVDSIPNQGYTGSNIQPTVKVYYDSAELVAGSDYFLSYTNNKNIGTATVTITGINSYSNFAKKDVKFKIVPKKIEGLTVVSTGTNKTDVKWNKEASAEKYRVQVYRGGQWKTYLTTTETKMTITGLTSATTYNVRVCGYKVINSVEYTGAYSSQAKLTTTPAKPNISATSYTASSITLSWTKQANATGYQLYKYDYDKAKYVLLKDIKSGATNSFKHSSLSANKKYRYRVRAYKTAFDGSTIYGAYSDGMTTYTAPKAPSLSKLTTPKAKTISATWTKVSSVSGYQVQWSTSSTFSSNYKSVNVSGSGTLTTKITTYQSKQKYYVRIRAYSTHDNKKYYSSWSNKLYTTTK